MIVIPAKAGIHFDFRANKSRMGSGLRRSDGNEMHERHPCVYMLASRERGTLYTGVTSDLVKRIREHKNDGVDGFTKKYRVHILVWYEQHETMDPAIAREKAVEEWKRGWKLGIERSNPDWRDLYADLLAG